MGIGGAGMSAIARLMTEQGFEVSGCDLFDSPLTESLMARGIPVEIGHDPAHFDIYSPDVLIISSAIPPDNEEVRTARNRDIPVYKRSDVMGLVMKKRTGIAVAGTHGKTTTTAMIAYILNECELDPSFIVGGILTDYDTNARAGKGEPFVVEADEYDRMFLGLTPKIIALTTLELDHPDMFKNMDEVRSLFGEFIDLLPPDGVLIASHDNLETVQFAKRRLLQSRPALTYGLTGGMWSAGDVRTNERGGVDFSLRQLGFTATKVSLQMPGLHNVQNATAAIAVASELEIPARRAAEKLRFFSGVRRRFELKGEAQGITVIDDYAHHPTAIEATLDAAHSRFGDRPIWAVWQPHTYHRTKVLLNDFATCFKRADHVIITDIYRSRDTETFGVGPENVLARMTDHPDARHVGGSLDKVAAYLAEHARKGDVVITLSAGDGTQVGDKLLAMLTEE
jgi:UDP-N-acetylmuramate--alanine ligase